MCSDQTKQTNLKRIYLWTNKRSLGTVFVKWLSNIPDAQIINGMFTSCYFYGPEYPFYKDAIQKNKNLAKETDLSEFPFVYDGSKATYNWAKTQLECDYPGKRYLICKDLSFCLHGKHDLIPKGFRHTFLIRHPHRMYTSWKNTFGPFFLTSNLKEIIEKYYSQFYNHKEQYAIFQYLQEHPELGDPNPLVFDADDLQNHPASILSQYCQAVDIPFTEDMLHWQPGIEPVKNWKISSQLVGSGLHTGELGFYQTAMESSQFLPPKKLPERIELDVDVLECVDKGMTFYEKLYNMRTIRP